MQPLNEKTDMSYPSDAEIAAAMRRAHTLRAEATASGLRKIGGAIRTLFRIGVKTPAPETEEFRSSLTALRSSAELLRDAPEIEPAQRRRLIDIVLAEEARLERLVERRFDGGGRIPEKQAA